eukprot:TRINITY_DN10879_c0_g1_i1.p1 TRINITY_DN10879_c0_g1~~TRINITY_DN10879_c0_g1_i1.p1  ORF type:complete len:825 (+),score=271.49 TRINITY_DN10879_c0_g1_i1:79-2553(+)
MNEKTALISKLGEVRIELAKTKRAKDKEIRELKGKIKDLTKDLEEVTLESNGSTFSSDQEAELRRKIENLERQKREQQEDLVEKVTKIRIEMARSKRVSAENEARLQQKLEEGGGGHNEELYSQNDDLINELETSKTKITELEGAIKTLEKQTSDLRKSKGVLADDYNDMKENCDQLRKDQEKSQKFFDEFKNQTDKLKKDLMEKEKELVELRQELSKVLKRQEALVRSLENEKRAIDNEKMDLNNKVKQLEMDVENTKKDRERINDTCVMLQQSLNSMTSAHSQTNQEARDAQSHIKSEMKDLYLANANLKASNESLKRDLRTAQDNVQESENKVISLEGENDKLRRTQTTLEKALSERDLAISELEDGRSKLRRTYSMKLQDAENSTNKYQSEMSELRETNTELTRRFKDLEDQRQRLLDLQHQMSNDSDDANDRAVKAEEEMKRLKGINNSLTMRVSKMELQLIEADMNIKNQKKQIREEMYDEIESTNSERDEAVRRAQEIEDNLELSVEIMGKCVGSFMRSLKSQMIFLNAKSIQLRYKQLPTARHTHNQLKAFKLAHLEIKRIILSTIGEQNTLKWYIEDETQMLNSISEHKYIRLFKNLENLLISYDNMTLEEREELNTAKEVVLNAQVFLSIASFLQSRLPKDPCGVPLIRSDQKSDPSIKKKQTMKERLLKEVDSGPRPISASSSLLRRTQSFSHKASGLQRTNSFQVNNRASLQGSNNIPIFEADHESDSDMEDEVFEVFSPTMKPLAGFSSPMGRKAQSFHTSVGIGSPASTNSRNSWAELGSSNSPSKNSPFQSASSSSSRSLLKRKTSFRH